jgi:hypothetical protein
MPLKTTFHFFLRLHFQNHSMKAVFSIIIYYLIILAGCNFIEGIDSKNKII